MVLLPFLNPKEYLSAWYSAQGSRAICQTDCMHLSNIVGIDSGLRFLLVA